MKLSVFDSAQSILSAILDTTLYFQYPQPDLSPKRIRSGNIFLVKLASGAPWVPRVGFFADSGGGGKESQETQGFLGSLRFLAGKSIIF